MFWSSSMFINRDSQVSFQFTISTRAMDAYDVFKKITRGAKFSRQHNPFLKPVKSSQKLQIKEEKVETDSVEEDVSNLNENQTELLNDSFTLLSGITPKPEKKGKKRKIQDDKEEARKKKMLKIEEINHYRNLNNINVVGRHIPEPFRTFDDFRVDADIIESLKNSGYEEPTPIQKQAVPIMLQNRQLLACAPTGSGKTAAFLIPIIQSLNGPQRQGFRALILCPTRELAKQTQRECVRISGQRGFRIHIISKIKLAASKYGSNSSKKFDILITTPNRICYLLKQDPPALNLSNIEWLVIDEADKLFESGNRGFREQLDEILNACNGSNRKIAMFSATLTPLVAKWSVRNMKGLIRVTIGQRNAATDLVEQELLFVGNEQGKLLAFRDLIKNGINPPVLVFVQSKERAQQLFNELIYDGINVDAIHGDRTQLQRDNTVRSFREGRIWVLICTELMARGVDFKGVNLVINYDFPPSAISYIHRVGRAGRAGRSGKAISFFTLDDTVNLRSIAHVLKDSGCDVPSYMLTMKKKSKKEKKHLEKSALKRDDITTKPFYDTLKALGKRRRMKVLRSRENLYFNQEDKNNEKNRKKKSSSVEKLNLSIKKKANKKSEETSKNKKAVQKSKKKKYI